MKSAERPKEVKEKKEKPKKEKTEEIKKEKEGGKKGIFEKIVDFLAEEDD